MGLRYIHPWRFHTTKTKTFDCVEMKREGARRIYEELKDKTVEEQIEYWCRGTDELKAWIQKERMKRNVASPQ